MRLMLRPKQGFSLIELLIIAPFAILLIGGLVVMATQATNSGLRTQGKAQIQSEVLSALDMIEQDVRTSVNIATDSTSVVALDGIATTTHPLAPGKMLINRNTCALVSSVATRDEATLYWLSYWISGRNLLRRYNFTDKWCGGSQAAQGNLAWQKHNISEYVIRDADITLSIDYDAIPNTSSANGMTVTLAASRVIGGQQVSYTGTVRMKSTNIK